MPIVRDGTVNWLGLTNPGVYIDIVSPTPLIAGAPSNIEALVGVASWGPVGSPVAFSTPDDYSIKFGLPLIRTYDMATHVWAASQVGNQIAFRGVRVTDGTDTAASATLGGTGGTLTAKYTGVMGNQISINFLNSIAAGSFAAILSFPGKAPERFNNLTGALAQITVTPGTGFTSVPSLSFPVPTGVNARQARASASLKVISGTLGSGGTGFVANDTVNLPNGVVITVNTVTGGVISTFTVSAAGSITQGSVPTNPVAQVSTSGAGTGATFNLVWGLGPATIQDPGQNYAAGPVTVTMTGGGGTGGSYTATASFWGALAQAINNGTAERGPSEICVFTAGSSTANPTISSPTTLTGGTDGAYGVGSAQMLGSDVSPRKGMYALRATGADCFALCDVTDTTTWAAQQAFAQSETMIAVLATASGDSIAGAVAARQSAAIDDYGVWLIEGDWPTFYDTQNGLPRLVSPQAYALGLAGNLSPEQSPINKPIGGVVATQTTQAGRLIADADLSIAENGGIDLIGRPSPGGAYFSFLTGRNTSSNTVARGIEWTRLTYWISRSLLSTALGSIIGQLQSSNPQDPLRQRAKGIADAFFAGVQSQNMIDTFATTCDLSNNPLTLQALGYLFLYAKVRYLNTVRYFIVKLAGGGNVTVTSQSTPPSPAQFTS